jgi:hypothetical protein
MTPGADPRAARARPLPDAWRLVADPRLRASSALALALAALAGGLFWLAQARWHAHAQASAGLGHQVAGLQATVRAMRGQAAEIARYGEAFAALGAQGSVGAFDRPRLLDRIEAALRPHREQIDGYELMAPAAVPLDAAAAPERYVLRRQTLRIDLRPAHEERFVAIVEDLARAAGGTATIEHCELARGEQAGGPALRASCRLSWYAFAAPDADAGAPQ